MICVSPPAGLWYPFFGVDLYIRRARREIDIGTSPDVRSGRARMGIGSRGGGALSYSAESGYDLLQIDQCSANGPILALCGIDFGQFSSGF